MDIGEWTEKKDITLADMQLAVTRLREAKQAYDDAKKISDSLYGMYKAEEEIVVSILKDANQKEFTVAGVGKVSITEQLSVQTPKTPEQKQAFFDWLKKEMGDDGFWAYATVNSQSLNSLYTKKVKEYGERGELLDIEGIDQPTSYTKLSLRKA